MSAPFRLVGFHVLNETEFGIVLAIDTEQIG